jgi:hypothetical protein
LNTNQKVDAIPIRNEVIGAAEKAQLKDVAINPSWIVEGNPKTRIKVLSDGSTDTTAFTVMWDCTAGRFNWFYSIDETVYILEGSVTLTLPNGEVHRLVAGSTYYFALGTQALWHVEQYVRKVAFCHSPMPAPLRLAKRMVRSLKRAVGKGGKTGINMFDVS